MKQFRINGGRNPKRSPNMSEITAENPLHIRIGHSPDPDDAFMFWALANDVITDPRFTFEHVLSDIETLNRWALEGRLEITALSLHAYPYVQDKYTLLPHGASMGDGYGPVLVCRNDYPNPGEEGFPEDPRTGMKVAIPGEMTSAWLELNIWSNQYLGGRWENFVVVPFDEIPQYVLDGKADVGLLIHEGQLTYESMGLSAVTDLGVWWRDETDGLPLPLGVNAVRSDLPADVQEALCDILGRSIAMALENRDEALKYAMKFGRGLDTDLADRFVGMYVNDLTQDYGDRGRAAITEALRRAEENNLYREPLVDLPPVGEVKINWLKSGVTS